MGLKLHAPMSRSKRHLEVDSLSVLEMIIEWMASLITTLLGTAYRWMSQNTHGASVISLYRRRIIIAHPSIERALGRHVDDTSLAHNVQNFGSAMFDLSPDGIQRIKDHDPRPTHRNAFSRSDAARSHINSAIRHARDRVDKEPDQQELMLGEWLFKLVNTTLVTSIWGPVNPWVSNEDGFWELFIAFTFALPTFLRPLPHITARRALEARSDLISQLRSFHFENREARTRSVAHYLNVVAISDPEWESNPDYFKVELLTAQGLTITPSAMAVWLVRHLLSDAQMLSRVVSQVRSIDAPLLNDAYLNAGEISKACPALAASLYETLRLHMTAIPRIVKEDFQVPMTESTTLLARRGDLLILPMTSFNLDPAVWGPDAGKFRLDRFLTETGRLSSSAVRRLRVFGVAGNMCPGRRIGVDAIMFVTATVLRTFDVEPVAGGRFPEPVPSNEPSIGFERVEDDVRVTMRRVKG